ncbi:MAG: T9SS C-terminal target domain-containing protein [Calditrichaeota bacterium]|nr:MAG: T9SS C-terminal target domain-containing protein [Calditrichota bacterium]
MDRRDFIKIMGMAGAISMLPGGWFTRKLYGVPARIGLSDPALQPKFANPVPNALDPGFKFAPRPGTNLYKVGVGATYQYTGLVDANGNPLPTGIFGYGQGGVYTWPGKTFEVNEGDLVRVRWLNELEDANGFLPHTVPVDTSLHWAYSLPGYTQYTIQNAGIPIVPHLHGGHNAFKFDGNPEFFFSPRWEVVGPQWRRKTYRYHIDQPAGTLWYHDHALGITRLNVYAGMAGFFIVRDQYDSGLVNNSLSLPVYPYEAAFAIQDRMFLANGELFYPAYPGDPFYDDFITNEIPSGMLPDPPFTGGGPTALAEFFGDHMVVNGVIWPRMDVEPRNYRFRLLNGCDSRFLAIQFFEVPPNATDLSTVVNGPLDFTVIGSDQGLASSPSTVNTLLIETGARYDIIVDFKTVTPGNRVIMKNIGGDEPFGGDLPGVQVFAETDRIMAFDVVLPKDNSIPDMTPTGIAFGPHVPDPPDRIRKVALFEGRDEYGRLQPLLGTAEPATDHRGRPIYWPNTQEYIAAGLVGQMEGSIPWHAPTTENPALNSTEEWEIWNVTGDAHPIHLHLVHFEVLGRQMIHWDSNADVDGFIPPGVTPADDGIYLVNQPIVQHNGTIGTGFRIVHPSNPADAYGPMVPTPAGYVENTRKDMVTALPGQITRIKAKFDKRGRYVWHCHILSHEDHEMMRVLHVGGGAFRKEGIAGADSENIPGEFSLEQNYPNPFNPSTTIRFRIPETERVEITIYNLLGQTIRTLTNQVFDAGQHTVIWDGRNDKGRAVASGIYLYTMKAGNFSKTRRMQLIR